MTNKNRICEKYFDCKRENLILEMTMCMTKKNISKFCRSFQRNNCKKTKKILYSEHIKNDKWNYRIQRNCCGWIVWWSIIFNKINWWIWKSIVCMIRFCENKRRTCCKTPNQKDPQKKIKWSWRIYFLSIRSGSSKKFAFDHKWKGRKMIENKLNKTLATDLFVTS